MMSQTRAVLASLVSAALVLTGLGVVQASAVAAASLSLHPSTPASVKKTGATLTTAAFTPPAGSVLVISVQTNGSGSNDVKSIAVRDNLTNHLTYHLVQTKGNATNDVYAKLYWAAVDASQPMTVTAAIGGSSNDYSMLTALVFTGANTAAPIGTSGGDSGAPGLISDSYTSTTANSWGWLTYGDWAQRGVPTVPAGESVHASYNVNGEDTYALLKQNSVTATAGTRVTMSTTSPTSGAQTTHIYFEVVPAPSSGETEPPTVPTNLSATAVSSSQINLAWTASTDNVGVTGYRIFRGGPQTGTSATTTFADTGLAANTQYSYTVLAYDAAGNVSGQSASASATTLPSNPSGPEPTGWFAGDPHVHRSCGGSPESVASMLQKMDAQDLRFISLLADMGNGEVQNPITDLPLVNGQDASVSTANRTVHWDAEWHWDATYTQYAHQALGGHICALGLNQASQVWQEYTSPVFAWAHDRNGVAGFAHMQYLPTGIPQSLDCCTPIEYPVEVALGSADFISEDVSTSGDTAIEAYYRLLNTGFRPGFAAGTDYPCGPSVGSLLTYSQIGSGQTTYRNWIDAIVHGRTVISRNGHNEFLNLVVKNTATPGDQVDLASAESVPVTVTWTGKQNLSGTIELVQNGNVIASKQTSVAPGAPATLTATVDFAKSGWLAARRMDGSGHKVHTAAVYVIVKNAPIRASVADAQFYEQWMDNLLAKTSPGGEWNHFFVNNLAQAQDRYRQAKAVFQRIEQEASGPSAPIISSFKAAPATITQGQSSTLSWTVSGNPTPTITIDNSVGDVTGLTSKAVSPSQSTTYTLTAQNSQGTVHSTTTVTVSQNAPQTIFTTQTPAKYDTDGPNVNYELGTRFTATANGQITAIRFFKAPNESGTHTGRVWNAAGQQVTSVVFSGETASGWQEQSLPTPLAIGANVEYMVTVNTGNTYYATTDGGLNSQVTNGSLSTVVGSNGRYGAVGAYPTDSWQNSNYFRDVVFTQ